MKSECAAVLPINDFACTSLLVFYCLISAMHTIYRAIAVVDEAIKLKKKRDDCKVSYKGGMAAVQIFFNMEM